MIKTGATEIKTKTRAFRLCCQRRVNILLGFLLNSCPVGMKLTSAPCKSGVLIDDIKWVSACVHKRTPASYKVILCLHLSAAKSFFACVCQLKSHSLFTLSATRPISMETNKPISYRKGSVNNLLEYGIMCMGACRGSSTSEISSAESGRIK